MNYGFYSSPIHFPSQNGITSREIRESIEKFCRRAAELWRAAAFIDSAEPGLLTPTDLETARRRGFAAARRVMADCPKGRARIAFYRALSSEGISSGSNPLLVEAENIRLLEDRNALADSYLRAVTDAALQYGAECWICPSPLRRDRLEAVFLPGAKTAFLSERAVKPHSHMNAKHVHLDRIPSAERKDAMRSAMRNNKKLIELLTQRAAAQLRNAEILRELHIDTCARTGERL